MLNKKIFYGSAVIPVIVAIAMITALPAEIEHTTYNHENGKFPPQVPLGEKLDQIVNNLDEASKIVGYDIPEPNLPNGVNLQLIGIAGDRMVVMYASPQEISKDTLNRDFMWKMQGIEIGYEKLPDYLSESDNNQLVQKWANSNDAELRTSSTGYKEGAYEMHKRQGLDGEFDQPARVLKAITDDVRVSVTGFYDVEVLKSMTQD